MAVLGATPLLLSIFISLVPMPSYPENIAAILFLISALAILLQHVYMVWRRSQLLRRVSGSVIEALPVSREL